MIWRVPALSSISWLRGKGSGNAPFPSRPDYALFRLIYLNDSKAIRPSENHIMSHDLRHAFDRGSKGLNFEM